MTFVCIKRFCGQGKIKSAFLKYISYHANYTHFYFGLMVNALNFPLLKYFFGKRKKRLCLNNYNM
jgi:hypothetical protein